MRSGDRAVPFALAAAIGMAVWFAASTMTGRREAWDAEAYWIAAYPGAIAVSAVLGLLYPERPWRWAMTLFQAQFVAMCIRNGELGNLWPMGLVLFAVIALPAIGAANLASRLRHRVTSLTPTGRAPAP